MRRAAAIALAGLGLTLTALLFDAAPLFVPGIAFALVGVLAPAWVVLASRKATVVRTLEDRRVIEGDPIEATLRVSSGLLRLPVAEVCEPLAAGPVPLPPRTRAGTVRIVIRFGRRGLRHIEPPALRVRDPLALATRVRRGAGAVQELLVLPRTSPIRWIDGTSGARESIRSALTRPQTLAAVDLDGLRPYRPGTSASRIHWPALARGAGLIERRLRAEGDTRPLVVLDARGSGPVERLDAAIRAAASLTLALARAGGCELLLPGERRPTAIDADLIAWASAHARRALLDGGPGTRAPALGSAQARLGAVFYVAAQPLERMPSAVYGIARGTRVLVVPEADRPGASFEVAGCHGYLLRGGAARLAPAPNVITAR
jgi:uncharacterized protein (DUF58 family)